LRDVTVAFKTFHRNDRLRVALSSLVGKGFGEVIVVDDGPANDPEKDGIYEKYSSLLPLRVIKLPYDTGLGYGRRIMGEECRTKYLLLIDDDMTVPNNVHILKEVLLHDKKLGAVAGCWIERGKVRCGGHDLREWKGYLIRYVPPRLRVNYAGDVPYFYFDFIPNSALFRIEAYRDYEWDDAYTIFREHLDYYWGHKKLGKWKFAVTPAVFFHHNPGGSRDYSQHRFNWKKYLSSERYFLQKWGLKGIVSEGTSLATTGPYRGSLWLYIKAKLPLQVKLGLAKMERAVMRIRMYR